jgi:hypothetical protein
MDEGGPELPEAQKKLVHGRMLVASKRYCYLSKHQSMLKDITRRTWEMLDASVVPWECDTAAGWKEG